MDQLKIEKINLIIKIFVFNYIISEFATKK